MWDAIVALLLIVSIFVWPVWLYRRMKKVQRMANESVQEQREPDLIVTPYVDEQQAADGTVLARPMVFDEALLAADKREAEMPGIERTLVGKR
jgi:hypothetical protein